MTEQTQAAKPVDKGAMRTLCRSAYDLQTLRIMTGNRVAGNFRTKLGMRTDGMTEDQLGEMEQDLLKKLRAEYDRITDGIVYGEKLSRTRRRTYLSKNFQPGELITELSEVFMVDNYIQTLEVEQQHFDDMERMLEHFPIYTEFLKGVSGVGPAMAGVIISEINIHKAEYVSSVWKYAGLDVVKVVQWFEDGKRHRVARDEAINDSRFVITPEGDFLFDGEIKCEVIGVGRNNHSYCLVKRPYIDREGNTQVKDSITYSPFLKTKLLGVLANSFLKAGGMKVDGKSMSAKKRAMLAAEHGLKCSDIDDDKLDTEVIAFLESKGMKIDRHSSPYTKAYYEYRDRLDADPAHRDKRPIVKHAMARRVMVKRFLVDLYANWRALEGLTVSNEYSEGVLGKVHGQAAEPGWQNRGLQ